MNLTTRSKRGIGISTYDQNGLWRLIEAKAKRYEKYYPCCPEPFPDIVFNITVQRSSVYQRVVYGFPPILLACLVPIMFLLPVDAGEKTIFGERYQFFSGLVISSHKCPDFLGVLGVEFPNFFGTVSDCPNYCGDLTTVRISLGFLKFLQKKKTLMRLPDISSSSSSNEAVG